MFEHLFLCGLSKTQRQQYSGGRELQLSEPLANVRLKVDDIRRRLLDNEADIMTDLIEIAAYVFAADCAVSRGGRFLKNMGKHWRRKFHLVIAVREPGRWSEPERLYALREALEFLSEDAWAFEFVELENPPSIQEYMNYGESSADRSGGTTIVLFSGGLDSFAGAVHELSTSNRHIVLLSRRLVGMTDARQCELASNLRQRYPRRVSHVPVRAGLTHDAKVREHTQRTRSFLLTALAIVAAVIEESDRVCLCENGVMSINLPISTQVVGARASRSTRPRSLMLLNHLARLVDEHEIAIGNPFIWKTKVEVVRELRMRPEAAFIRGTLSCSNTRDMSTMTPHCGKCAQCLQRRISTLAADAADADPEQSYAVDLLIGPRDKDEDLAMALDMVRSAFEYRARGNGF
jgi:7-cyano-7-deazaguanine synthase in queuosine biosynthesis